MHPLDAFTTASKRERESMKPTELPSSLGETELWRLAIQAANRDYFTPDARSPDVIERVMFTRQTLRAFGEAVARTALEAQAARIAELEAVIRAYVSHYREPRKDDWVGVAAFEHAQEVYEAACAAIAKQEKA